MKVRVLKSYIDKETKRVVKKGTVIDDMSEERFDEITRATGYLQKLEDTEHQERSIEQVDEEETQNESVASAEEGKVLNEMSVAQLKELAKEKGVPEYYKLKKEELVAVLEQ